MNKVKAYSQKMIIPTYEVGEEEKNPMFFEKRVYQGSSGKVYPNPVREKIFDDRHDKEYNVVILENDYIYVVVMPELGGRIYTAYDKSNRYDFAYHNEVIKPALVGLLGPWISGGIEFNWPQHHRPSTYMPLNSKIVHYNDGSAGVFVGEIENMFGLKGMTEIKLYPDKAYIEINVQIYNRSDLPQTFLWWANPAVKVNEFTKTIMPPDVTAVIDHGKRAVSEFPIAKGEYYKFDYSEGVDISRYKNIQVPTSFMAYKSDFDFVGGYDFKTKAGIYHFADHHISPGKKQWTWGCGDFGQAWDRNLTDENGPYVELMTGCFTDNQPDFTYILPQEEKTFTQYFMPYKKVGEIKQANKDFCFNIANDKLIVYSTGEFTDVKIEVKDGEKTLFEDKEDFTPNKQYEREGVKDGYTVTLKYNGEILTYNEKTVEKFPIPEPASAIPQPQEVKTVEELYLFGLHIEQYRHATRLSEDYYLEGLKRDDGDLRINNAYGELLLRRGRFEESKKYFKKAIEKATIKNPNPVNSQPYFNLGVADIYTGDYDEAYDNFYKCIWCNDNKSGAFYYLSAIAFARKNFTTALNHVERALQYNSHNIKAGNLKGRILSAMGNKEEAIEAYKAVRKIDVLDVISALELAELTGDRSLVNDVLRDVTSYEITNIVCDYFIVNEFLRAEKLLEYYLTVGKKISWIPIYYLAYAKHKQGKEYNALKNAEKYLNEVCFASRLSDIPVLRDAIKTNDYFAYYQLGNLFYDKKQYELAIDLWRKSERANETFPTVKRNIALYLYNKARKFDDAVVKLEEAFNLDKTDSRVLMELYQLYKITGRDNKFLYDFLCKNLDVASKRDDMYLAYISLVCDFDGAEKAEYLIMNRHFHPWEGGEGKVTNLYKKIKIALYKDLNQKGKTEKGIEKLKEGLSFPHNLGEGKLCLDTTNDIYYYLGCAYSIVGNESASKESFEKAALGDRLVAENMYYNDAPVEYKYYMALALNKLGRYSEAQEIKKSFTDYAKKNYGKKIIVDYFAVSLPDMLIWEQDLDESNNRFCDYLNHLAKDMQTHISK